MIRSEPPGLIGLIEIPDVGSICLALHAVQHLDHGCGGVGARLELDPRVEILGVLADHDEVDALVPGADARGRSCRGERTRTGRARDEARR